MSVLDRVTTKDILAVMVVGGVLGFQGISAYFERPLDAGLMGMAGLIIGYYFPSGGQPVAVAREEPLPEPAVGGEDGSD